jgi:hypothetical protein
MSYCAADDPCVGDHVQAVEQTEPAQKPFGQNGFRFGRTEELLEQTADRSVPPRHLSAGVVEHRIADRVHGPHRIRRLGGGAVQLTR